MKKICLLILAITTLPAFAAESHIIGRVSDITSFSGGLLLRVNGNEKPTGCPQTSAWMLIPKEQQTMISVALAMYMSDKRNAVIYVDTASIGSY